MTSTTYILHELAQNAYDLVGAAMAIECVTACKAQLVESYTEEMYAILLARRQPRSDDFVGGQLCA